MQHADQTQPRRRNTGWSVFSVLATVLMTGCQGPGTPRDQDWSSDARPDWVNGLQEPLQELPRDQWAVHVNDRATDYRSRVGEPRELGGRLGSGVQAGVGARSGGASGAGGPASASASAEINLPDQITFNFEGAGLEQAVRPEAAAREPSPLELQFRGQLPERPDRELRQFGYDVVARLGAGRLGLDGTASDDHVVAPGDEIIIDLTTDKAERFRAVVDPDGTLEVDSLLAVPVGGQSFADARQTIEEAIARVRRNYDLSIGLGRLASVPVRVVGEAEAPGVVDAGPRPSIIDAIAAAGVRPTGSLRRVTIQRPDEDAIVVDLYDYLLGNSAAPDIRVRRGDTVVIPPIGPTIAVAGSVQRPGIYELPLDPSPVGVDEAITMAGGATGFAITDQVQIERTTGGRRELIDVNAADAPMSVMDGDMLLVGAVDGRLHPVIEVRGEVARPGRFQYRQGMTVGDLLRLSGGLTVDAFTDQVILSRVAGEVSGREVAWDAPASASARRVLIVDAWLALQGDPSHDIALEPLDHLRVDRYDQARELPRVEIIGAVSRAGEYELTIGLTVRDLVALAGSLTSDAHREDAELVRRRRTDNASRLDVDRYRIPLAEILGSSGDAPMLKNGDRLIIRRLGVSEVRVRADGLVRFPGEYVLPAGSRITDLIAAAGGVLDGGDLRAARFTRESVKRDQRDRWDELSERTRQVFERNLEKRVNSARSKEAFSARIQLDQVQSTLERLRSGQTTGRVILPFTDEGFPDSDANLALEAGDTLTIPRSTTTVTVQGHVFNPITVVHDPSRTADDLIRLAGGMTEVAADDRLYVVRADGRVASVSQRAGRFDLDAPLLAGDIVLVPPRPLSRDPGSVALDLLLLARTAGEAAALWNLAIGDIDDGSLSIIDSPASPRSDSAPPSEILREFQR